MWRALEPVIGKKKEASEPPNITPDALNNFYVNIGPSTSSGIPPATQPVHTRLPRVTTSSFKVQPVDLDTLLGTLLSMKSSSSLGNDGVSVAMLQRYVFGFAEVLLDVVNSSLHTGIVPSPWKRAQVIPIPKGKSTKTPADTRPISLLPAIMKLVEKIVQSQLNEYLETNHLLSGHQHGYRKNHSTETALSVISDKTLQAMDRGEISILALLDLSKCFDVVPHRNLLDKLSMYGIETEWFASYLAGHTQQVVIRGADGTAFKSAVKANTIGVYQGGSLSCAMFSLFSNDLGLHVNDDVTLVQYADDVQLLISGRKQELPRIIAQLEENLFSLFQWFCHHRMKVNEQKTQMIVLGTHQMLRNTPAVTLSFNGSLIHESETVKNLGVTIDRNLTYQPHVDALNRKCTGMLMALNHARHVIPSDTLATLVNALVISVVRYCLSVYGSCNNSQMHRIQKIINFGARVVSGRRRHDHISDVVHRLGWMSAEQLAEYHAICLVRSVVCSHLPETLFSDIGTPISLRHSHETRSVNQLSLPAIRTEAGRRQLCYRGVKLTNAINVPVTDQQFRKDVKRELLSRKTTDA